jgi:transcriptional antiterminator Rof (Rho-off)
MDKMREELLPCPFCGEKPVCCINYGEYDIACQYCGIYFRNLKTLERWNTRAATKEAEKYREALEIIATQELNGVTSQAAEIAKQALQK